MKIRGVDFILHRVTDLGRAIAFYRDALGLTLEMRSDEFGWAEFNCGDLTLALNAGQKVVPGAGARLALAVDDLDRAHAELVARGTKITQPPQDYGVCRACEVVDPDGNAILLHRRADGSFGHSAPT